MPDSVLRLLNLSPSQPAPTTPIRLNAADQRERYPAQRGRQVRIHDMLGQVDLDEGDMEAAHEEAESQQQIAAMGEGFGKRVPDALVRLSGFRLPFAGHGKRQRHDQQ